MGKNGCFDKNEANSARAIISALSRKGVKLLALDFDKTIVSVHTAGFWKQGTPKLAEHVRPSFKALIRAGLDSNINICIVTHSTQPALIRDVLELVLPDCNVKEITVRASTKDWMPAQRGSVAANLVALGKEQHISWVITYLFNTKHIIIQPQEIFLIDDDLENVDIAREFGHRAYQVTDDVSLEGIKNFVDKIDAVHVARSRSFLMVKSGKKEKGLSGGSAMSPTAGQGVAMRDSVGRQGERQCMSLQSPTSCGHCEPGGSRDRRSTRH